MVEKAASADTVTEHPDTLVFMLKHTHTHQITVNTEDTLNNNKAAGQCQLSSHLAQPQLKSFFLSQTRLGPIRTVYEIIEHLLFSQ